MCCCVWWGNRGGVQITFMIWDGWPWCCFELVYMDIPTSSRPAFPSPAVLRWSRTSIGES